MLISWVVANGVMLLEVLSQTKFTMFVLVNQN